MNPENKSESNKFSIKEKNEQKKKKYLENSNYEKVTDDGNILKKITMRGFGKSNPKDSQEAFLNYVGTLEDGKSVENTFIHQEPKRITLGKIIILPGLEIAVKFMTMEEKANVIVFPDYGFILQERINSIIKEKPDEIVNILDTVKDFVLEFQLDEL